MTATRRAAFVALALALAAGASDAGGLDLHASADAADVGLPAYPGSIRRSDPSGDPTGFSFGLWGESFGIKLAVASYRSVDGIDKVAAFYRDALARYGPVLDCSRAAKKPDAPKSRHDDKSDKDKPVTCDSDSSDAGARLYKVGTEHSQRVFKATPWHDGTSFELVRIEQHGTD
ncbi:hypothetical protein [Scleromatobacter humisilvae]|uniref:Uncharacterized protein n=1 Tax=Scleromatobacter humisilvae TaxID=2897159 RepID=A0A9X1YLG7_9BURK|nr:hypothetical protein [Scleromatobacter humisilvae]MCK9686923.1 hypothetical protein [Scleromatobacter humisilvae]